MDHHPKNVIRVIELPKTKESWENYRRSEQNISDFLKVLKSCIEEASENSSKLISTDSIIAEVEFFLEKHSSDLFSLLLPMIKESKSLLFDWTSYTDRSKRVGLVLCRQLSSFLDDYSTKNIEELVHQGFEVIDFLFQYSKNVIKKESPESEDFWTEFKKLKEKILTAVPHILMKNELTAEMLSSILLNIKEFELPKKKLSVVGQESFRSLLEKFKERSQMILDSYLPGSLDNPDLIDIKNLLKFVYINPEYIQRSFELLLQLFRNSWKQGNSWQKEKHRFKQEIECKELSFFMKFSIADIQTPAKILKISQGSESEFSFEVENQKLFFCTKRLDKPEQRPQKEEIMSVQAHHSLTLSYSHSQFLKSNPIQVNQKQIQDRCEVLKKFDRLSFIQVDFQGELDYLIVFNKASSTRELNSSNFSKILEALTEKPDPSLVFLAASEGEDVMRENFLQLRSQPNDLHEIFKKLGGINWLIPLFDQTENSENFAYLFYVLKEFVDSMDRSQVPELFSLEFFQSLHVLMAERIQNPCEKMVRSLLDFIHVIKDLDVLKVVIENLMFNEKLWSKVENHSIFIMAFNSILEIERQVFEKIFDCSEKILKLIHFFISFNKKNQAFISSYLFRILEELDEFFAREHLVLLKVLTLIVEKMNTEAEGQHLRNFLQKISDHWKEKSKNLKLEKFDCISFCEQILDTVFPVLIKNSKEHNRENGLEFPVIAFVLDVFSENIYMYRRDPITQRVIDFKIDYSREKEFYNKLYTTLDGMKIDLNKLDLLEIFCKFSEKSVVKNIMLYSAPSSSSVLINERKSCFFFDLVTNQLYTFYESTRENPAKFCEVLEYVKLLMKGNPKLFIKVVESSCFPEWSFQFFEKYEKTQIEPFYKFFMKIFTKTQFFKNFNSLRKLVFWFQEKKTYKDGLDFLLTIVNDPKMEKRFYSDPMILVEFLNVFEDVSCDYSVNTETFETFKRITLSLFEICKKIEFSLSFPQVSMALPMVRKPVEKKIDKSIIFRDGGIIRQLLFFSIKLMREKLDPDIENCIISTFASKSSSSKEEEWKKIKNSLKNNKDKNSNKSSEKLIVKSPIPMKNSKLKLQSFLVLYVYFEWANCIEKDNENPRLKESQENLVKFLNTENSNLKEIKKKLKECLKLWLPDINEAYRNPEQWLERIKPYKYSREIDPESDFKPKRLEEKLDDFFRNFSKGNFENFKLIKNELLYFYVFYCTTLKMELVSKYYKIEVRSVYILKEESFDSRKSSIESCQELKNLSLAENEVVYRTTLKRYLDIFNRAESPDEKLSLKSLKDSLGRCVFVKKIRKNADFLSFRKKSSLDSISIQSMPLSSPKNSFGSCDVQSNPADEDISTTQSFQAVFSPKTLEVECELIKIYGSYSGALKITENEFFFKTKPISRQESPFTSYPGKKSKVVRASFHSSSLPFKDLNKIWLRSEVIEAVPKTLMHVKSGLELKLSSGKSKLLNFFTKEEFFRVQKQLKSIEVPVIDNLNAAKQAKHQWKKGELSNFEYLLKLNDYAGRSFNNLTQYPIFPWVLKNYSEESIDLKSEKDFRKLEFPIGAQEELGRTRCKKKYDISKQEEKIGYHHGSHYSNAGIVLHFMLRVEPFTQQAKNLQGGSFDLPDRLFGSLDQAWKSSQACFGDCKELVPELFYLPEVLQNKNKNDFKKRQDGKTVDSVELPPWAKGSVFRFLRMHQKALESEIVSQRLPDWINLIFGCKQRDSEARDSFNLFHPVTYDDKYLSFLKEYEESFHSALSQQVFHFGQTPQKLFSKSHGSKKELMSKPLLSERLLNRQKAEIAKICSAEVQVLLISLHFIFVVKKTDSKALKLVRFTGNERLNENLKEFEIPQLRTDLPVLGCLFDDNQVVLTNSGSNCLFFYSFSGELKHKTRLFHSEIVCIAGNPIVAVGCSDSSLVLVKENNSKLQLFGHFEPIKGITVSEKFCAVISCTSKTVLVHNYRTGNILNKIETDAEKVACNAFGLIFVGSKNELKVFYINGDLVRSFSLEQNCQWGSLGDCIWINNDSNLRIEDPYFEDESRVINSIVSQSSVFCYNEKKDLAVFAVNSDIYKIS